MAEGDFERAMEKVDAELSSENAPVRERCSEMIELFLDDWKLTGKLTRWDEAMKARMETVLKGLKHYAELNKENRQTTDELADEFVEAYHSEFMLIKAHKEGTNN